MEKIANAIFSKSKFIDSTRFTRTSLSNYPLSNLISLREFIKIHANKDMIIKKMNSMEVNTKSVNIQDNLILRKCLCCNRNFPKN